MEKSLKRLCTCVTQLYDILKTMAASKRTAATVERGRRNGGAQAFQGRESILC